MQMVALTTETLRATAVAGARGEPTGRSAHQRRAHYLAECVRVKRRDEAMPAWGQDKNQLNTVLVDRAWQGD